MIKFNRNRCVAFTLIELLVSVAIISVLAAISVSNISEAQTRAKIARVRSDLRTVFTAIEMYKIDHNHNPRMAHFRFYGDPEFDIINGQGVRGILSKVLSTPISYVRDNRIADPFMRTVTGARVDEILYTYQDLPEYVERIPSSTFWPAALEWYGVWRVGSVGPDLTFDHGFKNSSQLPYDPSNGTVSLGNLWVSHVQSSGQNTLPPNDLLGVH